MPWRRAAIAALLATVGIVSCTGNGAGKKRVNEPCLNNTDCADNICHAGICAASAEKALTNGAACTGDGECRSFSCSGGACAPGASPGGTECLYSEECGEGLCTAGLCGAGVDGGVDAATDAPAADGYAPWGDRSVADGALGGDGTDCVPGGVCTPTNPCKTGTYTCSNGTKACTESGDAPDGVMCGGAKACKAGTCVSCGMVQGEPCCGATCLASLECVAGVCECGAKDQPCCGGTICDSGLVCDKSGTCSCGKQNEACCAGLSCDTGLVCWGGGALCSCIVEVASTDDGNPFIRWTDGTTTLGTAGTSQTVMLPGGGAPLLGLVDISAGYAHGCGVKADGTVWCWPFSTSSNSVGELGWGHTNPPTTVLQAGQVVAAGGGALKDAARIVTGGRTNCVVKTDGTAWCWGDGASGQLGNGTQGSSSSAVQVLSAAGGPAFGNVDRIDVDQYHACALRTDGTLWCWGDNYYGQLGNGSYTDSLYPKQVFGLAGQVTDMSVGGPNTCAALTNSSLWCWGDNMNGQVGTGVSGGSVNIPTQVLTTKLGAGFTGVKEVHAGSYKVCAGKGDGTIWCWPYNETGTGNQVYTPGIYVYGGQQVLNAVWFELGQYGYVTYLTTGGELTSGYSGKLLVVCP